MRTANASTRLLLAAVGVFLSAFAWQQPAAASILYVDNVRTCAALVPCYSTIMDAVNAAVPGDTISVFPGVYHESVIFAAGKDSIILTAQLPNNSAVIAPPLGAGNAAVTIFASNVQLMNLLLEADGAYGAYVVLDLGASGTIIYDNVIRSIAPSYAGIGMFSTNSIVRQNTLIGGGIFVSGTTGVLVAGNLVTNAPIDGISFANGQTNKIQNNVVRSSARYGIVLDRDVEVGNIVQDNVVTASGGDGILLYGARAGQPDSQFGRNIVRRNTSVENALCDINDNWTAPSPVQPNIWNANRFFTKCGAATN